MREFLLSRSTSVTVCFRVIEILSVLGIVMFLSVGFFSNINIGNIAGALMCGAVLILSLKRKQLPSIWDSLAENVWGRAFLAGMVTLIIVSVLAAVTISVFMIRAISSPPDEPATVIVLGCNVKPTGPSTTLERRIQAAYDYLSENSSVICIAAGGQGDDEPMTEALAIKNRLVELGISPDRIYMDEKSVNTFQNIRNSIEIIDSLGLERKAVIITSDYHQLRASVIADKQGLENYSVSSETPLYYLPAFWIREWFGVLHEIIIGRK